jgi:hypothetical protein
MRRLVYRIVLMNIGLFILVILLFTLAAFSLGYASKNDFDSELTILYASSALLQIAINLFVYRRVVFSNLRVLFVIVLTVTVMFLLYLIIF